MESKFNNIMVIIVGALFIKLGGSLCFNSQIDRRFTGFVLELQGYNVPVGIASTIIGLLLVISGVKNIRKQDGGE